MTENADLAWDWLARLGLKVEKMRAMGLTDDDAVSLYHFLQELLRARARHSKYESAS